MTRCLILLLPAMLWALPASAQEGHPLVGTWQGEWGSDAQLLTLILEWDGKNITGIANPGPTTTDIGKVSLDSSTWTVIIDTDLKDEAGNTLHFTATGKLDNIGSPMRVLNAEWSTGTDKGNFVLERQGGA